MSQRMVYQTEATREKILATARRLFSGQGYFDTQMKDIASAVGMSRNTLYRYYRDKTDLGFAILEQVLIRLSQYRSEALTEATAQAGTDPAQLLVDSLISVMTHPELTEEFRFMAEFDAYFSGQRIPDDFTRRFERMMVPDQADEWIGFIAQSQADGHLRQDIPAGELFYSLFYTLKALQHQHVLRGNVMLGFAGNSDDVLLPHVASMLIKGLKPESQQPGRTNEKQTTAGR